MKEVNCFLDLHIHPEIFKAVQEMGFHCPSEVQAAAIPLAMAGHDIVAQAQTGTGKTVAFGIPIVEKMQVESRQVQALILAPTRELAIQISEEIGRLGLFKRIRSVPLYGGQPIEVQKNMLKQRVHVVVATPGRLLDHMRRGHIDLSQVQIGVLDEADRMLDMGLIEEVKAILAEMPSQRQTMMFSATITSEVEALSKVYMSSPHRVTVGTGQTTAENVDQYYYLVDEKAKIISLTKLLKVQEKNPTLVFCRTKAGVVAVAHELKAAGIKARGLQGDMSQDKRLDTIRSFKQGKFPCLVATDVAARGIDIDALSLVVNYDIPLDPESYVHRIGRTGRAGHTGKALTFATEEELQVLRRIEEANNITIPRIDDMEVFQKDLVRQNNSRKLSLEEDRTKMTGVPTKSEVCRLYIGMGRKHKIRPGDIVGALVGAAGLPGDAVGVIEIYETYSFVDILGGYGEQVLEAMQENTLKGKRVKIERAQ